MPFYMFYHVYPAHILRGHSTGVARTFARTLHGLDQICTDFARIHTDVHGRTDAARTLHGHLMVPIVQDWGCVSTHLKRGSNWAFISTQKLHLLSHRAKYHTPPIKITDPTSIQTSLHTNSHQTHSLRNPIRAASSRPRACASHLPPTDADGYS